MKRKLTAAAAALLILVTGCGKNSSTSDSRTEEASSAETSSSETTTSTTTTTATSTITTTITSKTTTTTTTTVPVPPEDLVLEGMDVVGVYDELTLSDLIIDKNVELSSPDDKVDTAEPGEHELNVKYKYKDHEFSKKLSYTVADNEPPVVLNAGWSSVHIAGTPFDLSNYVGFADNYDRSPVLTYSGDISPDTPGSYPITCYVTDSSGNETSWDTAITVAESKPVIPDNNDRVWFEDFMDIYGGEGIRFGIDVSTWQGDVDFEAVRDAGCSFVFIRIGYYYDHIVMDDYFWQNLERARAAGLDVGLYFYTTDNTEEGVREHARWIAEQLDGSGLELPIAFDWEEFSNFQQYGMNIHDLNEIYSAFADELSEYGYRSMLYSSKNFLNNFWSSSSKAARPVWLAHFVDETDYEGDYSIWQASCFGRIPGIAGDVDLNIMYYEP